MMKKEISNTQRRANNLRKQHCEFEAGWKISNKWIIKCFGGKQNGN